MKGKLLVLLLLFVTGAYLFGAEEYQKTGLTSADRAMPVFFEALRAKMPFSLGWKADTKDPQKWKAAGLEKARDIMIPYPDATKFDMKVIEEIDRGKYTAKKIVFNVTAESRVMALLLVPKGKGPFPAALMLHDHGSEFIIGKEKLIQTWNDDTRLAESKMWAEKFFSGLYPGDELAKKGYVVLAVDALGWGDRTIKDWKTDSQQALASNLFNLVTSYASIIALEDVKAAKFLAELPQVDKKKVAAIGFSMGAFRAWQVAALSDDITATVVDCWMATMQGLMVIGNNQLKGQSAFTMLHPFIGRYLDYPDVAGLAAPKPMLIYAGEKDGLFPVASVNEAFDKMKKIWTAFGAADNFETKIWPLGHVFQKEQQDEAYKWLDKQFKSKK
jgi:dienelactone hydrolase